MLSNLIGLWALQRLDSELDTLRVKVEEIPRKIQGMNLTVSDEKQELEACKKKIVELKKEYKLAEVDIKEADGQIGAKSAQLYSAKTNEQYKAFLKEIEHLRQTKSSQEEKMITLMEQLEQSEARVNVLEREVKAVEGETVDRVKTLERELKELQQAVATREEERVKVHEGIDRDVVPVYERIRKSKHGVAVVSAGNDRCGGCLNPLPPQMILEIGKKDRLYFCEHCGRILLPSDLT
jgi:predicted  nucleic acid-binding Zn-ribbon protein